jgi:hypothetical protein
MLAPKREGDDAAQNDFALNRDDSVVLAADRSAPKKSPQTIQAVFLTFHKLSFIRRFL